MSGSGLFAGVGQIPGLDQGGQAAGGKAMAKQFSPEYHLGKPGMDTGCGQAAAVVCDLSPVVQGTQPGQKIPGPGPGRFQGGRSSQLSSRGSETPRQSQLQHQRGQVGLENFRTVKGDKALVDMFGPEAEADTWTGPAGTAPALVCRGFGYGQGFQAVHAGSNREFGHPGQAGIHHHFYPFDGQGGFGNGGGQDDFPVSGPGRGYGRGLGFGSQIAEQRENGKCRVPGCYGFKILCQGTDLGGPRQKDQDIAVMVCQGPGNGCATGRQNGKSFVCMRSPPVVTGWLPGADRRFVPARTGPGI